MGATTHPHETYGPPDVLQYRDIDIPRVEADEVLVRVHAAGLNQGDYLAMRGWPYIGRLMAYGMLKPGQPVLGTDVAGRVEAIGANVDGFCPGDEVFG